ncbi:DNA recombination protein RmuC [Prosthecomicrobium sp. N25]|uniref:DNA recombination protein RmuC n=1 Tax=Prosthecomicrobium sp. N25 TaxID=3129254 RepID=UPI0030784E78
MTRFVIHLGEIPVIATTSSRLRSRLVATIDLVTIELNELSMDIYLQYPVAATYAALAATAVALLAVLLIAGQSRRQKALLVSMSGLAGLLDEANATLRGLPDLFRGESRIGREEQRHNLAAHQQALEARLGTASQSQADQLSKFRIESGQGRTDLQAFLKTATDGFADSLARRLDDMRLTMREHGERLEKAQAEAREVQRTAIEMLVRTVEERLATSGKVLADQLGQMRQEATASGVALQAGIKLATDGFAEVQSQRLADASRTIKEFEERTTKDLAASREQVRLGLADMVVQLKGLIEQNEAKQEALRAALTAGLDQLRKENEGKLEQMRLTVDEKLQGTLEARLGESFKQVSERLEQVHKGLGEMQTLANGVGDLKRVLTNVKSRGGWGEVQLGVLLEDMLTPDQYARNVRIRPESGELVEFAVRLPGKEDDKPVFLPIDAKFPQDGYERLLAAQEGGLADEVEKAGAALERAIRLQARTICEKYVHPPHSTDFAIMYLPTEGLYAEVIRRPGLCADIQSTHRILLTGPTTLSALLTSLQMGFRTLAIEKRSSEVWQVLAAAKTEFKKYGEVWDKLGKQLETAQNTVSLAGRRTRAIERKLRSVETIEVPDGFFGDLIAAPDEDEDGGSERVTI